MKLGLLKSENLLVKNETFQKIYSKTRDNHKVKIVSWSQHSPYIFVLIGKNWRGAPLNLDLLLLALILAYVWDAYRSWGFFYFMDLLMISFNALLDAMKLWSYMVDYFSCYVFRDYLLALLLMISCHPCLF